MPAPTEELERWIAALKDPDAETRCKAAEELWEREDPRSVPALAEALYDSDPDVCRAAGNALRFVKDRRILDILLEAMDSPRDEVRRSAAYTLGYTHFYDNARVIPRLVVALSDPHGPVRDFAANAIGEHSQFHEDETLFDATVEPLMRGLKDPDIAARQSAAYALWQLKRPEAKEELADALYDEDRYMRDLVALALAAIGDERALEPLIAALSDGQYHRDPCGGLADLGDPRAVEPLIRALRGGDADMRADAANALGRLDDPRAVAPLLESLKDEEIKVRKAAVSALGKLRSAEAIQCIQPLVGDADSALHESAIGAIGDIGDTAAVHILAGLIKSPDVQTRRYVVYALEEVRHSQAMAPLIMALKDEDPGVRSLAAEVIGKTYKGGNSSPYAPLRVAAHDLNADVRQAAVKALGEVAIGPATDALIAALQDPQSLICCTAAIALGGTGGYEHFDALRELLKSEFSHLRWHAVAILGKIGDEEFLPDLKKLSLSDPDASVRQAAAMALKEVRERVSQAID